MYIFQGIYAVYSRRQHLIHRHFLTDENPGECAAILSVFSCLLETACLQIVHVVSVFVSKL
jgi:hypothetical protein